jgi:hypothetical protein
MYFIANQEYGFFVGTEKCKFYTLYYCLDPSTDRLVSVKELSSNFYFYLLPVLCDLFFLPFFAIYIIYY